VPLGAIGAGLAFDSGALLLERAAHGDEAQTRQDGEEQRDAEQLHMEAPPKAPVPEGKAQPEAAMEPSRRQQPQGQSLCPTRPEVRRDA